MDMAFLFINGTVLAGAAKATLETLETLEILETLLKALILAYHLTRCPVDVVTINNNSYAIL